MELELVERFWMVGGPAAALEIDYRAVACECQPEQLAGAGIRSLVSVVGSRDDRPRFHLCVVSL
jgi:hypothetical protein